jgi:DNA-binding transcriptional LysR family regulator
MTSAQPSLYYLHTFHAVAELRSFTRAARALDLSQPAVSAHIRALEHYYRARLFEVRHRRVYLTAEGDALFAYTERVFNLLREAERAVAAIQTAERGHLAVAASPTIGIYLLPAVLQEYVGSHPAVQVDLSVGTSGEVEARVLAEEVPLGLVEAPVTDTRLDVQALGTDELILAVPPAHPWARAGALALADLHGAPVLRREAASGTQAFVDSLLEQAGVTMHTTMVLGDPEALKQAVLVGSGVAWLPRLAVTRELAAGTIVEVPVAGLSLERTLWRITLGGVQLPPATRAFLQLIAERLRPRERPY